MFMLDESRIRMLIVSLTTSVNYVSPSPFPRPFTFFAGPPCEGGPAHFCFFLRLL
jgi:hypothetical protein